MKKTQIVMNKPVYLDLSILELSKMVMYKFWYDYVKAKYGEKVRLCCVDTDSLIIYIKTKNVYSDAAKDAETRTDSSNNELDRTLPKRKK